MVETAAHHKLTALALVGRDGKGNVGGTGQELPDLLDRFEL